jgi:haloalkane dehalogenase
MPNLPDYPFESRWHVRPDGLRMHYLDEGQGEAVVMVHGNPTWSYYYRRLVLALRGTHRCLVPDHIGMGRSDKPGSDRYPFTLAARIADFGAWMDAVAPSGPVNLVVHDWGGIIALAWAVEHPDRVARLVVLNTAAFPMLAGKRLPLSLRMTRTWPGAAATLYLNSFARGAARLGVARPLEPAVRRALLSPYDSPPNRIAVLRFVQDIPTRPGENDHALVARTGERLEHLRYKPALIAWGLRDFVFDADYLAEWRRRFPEADVHAFDDAGHYVLEDAHERIVPAVRQFLAKPAL